MIAIATLAALGQALELARNLAIGLFLWLCAALLAGPLIGMWLRRRRQQTERAYLNTDGSDPLTTGARAACFLCGAPARRTALKRAGQLWICSDEEACGQRRAERVAARGTEAG